MLSTVFFLLAASVVLEMLYLVHDVCITNTYILAVTAADD